MTGKNWFYAFKARHKELALRELESTPMARAKGFNKKNVLEFFYILERVIDENKFDAARVFNVDDTGFSTVQKRCQKVLAMKGKCQGELLQMGKEQLQIWKKNECHSDENETNTPSSKPTENISDPTGSEIICRNDRPTQQEIISKLDISIEDISQTPTCPKHVSIPTRRVVQCAVVLTSSPYKRKLMAGKNKRRKMTSSVDNKSTKGKGRSACANKRLRTTPDNNAPSTSFSSNVTIEIVQDDWFCSVCEENVVENMVQYLQCHTWQQARYITSVVDRQDHGRRKQDGAGRHVGASHLEPLARRRVREREHIFIDHRAGRAGRWQSFTITLRRDNTVERMSPEIGDLSWQWFMSRQRLFRSLAPLLLIYQASICQPVARRRRTSRQLPPEDGPQEGVPLPPTRDLCTTTFGYIQANRFHNGETSSCIGFWKSVSSPRADTISAHLQAVNGTMLAPSPFVFFEERSSGVLRAVYRFHDLWRHPLLDIVSLATDGKDCHLPCPPDLHAPGCGRWNYVRPLAIIVLFEERLTRRTAREQAELASAEEVIEFTNSKYWKTAIVMSASGSLAIRIQHKNPTCRYEHCYRQSKLRTPDMMHTKQGRTVKYKWGELCGFAAFLFLSSPEATCINVSEDCQSSSLGSTPYSSSRDNPSESEQCDIQLVGKYHIPVRAPYGSLRRGRAKKYSSRTGKRTSRHHIMHVNNAQLRKCNDHMTFIGPQSEITKTGTLCLYTGHRAADYPLFPNKTLEFHTDIGDQFRRFTAKSAIGQVRVKLPCAGNNRDTKLGPSIKHQHGKSGCDERQDCNLSCGEFRTHASHKPGTPACKDKWGQNNCKNHNIAHPCLHLGLRIQCAIRLW
ncbi:hypothetical protein PR048_012591 [Dryococelus australis]|uniref:HTH CENPB-type domain-containing protein n=1 Tax=Dryococelus australis TaxID=614101 RepID=A0ABQ9HPU1_9NEOP|nr:hypothetical protein PR048_012591 [Dryococelus australis]